MTHKYGLRVYYEDTDLAGVVYHANFFKFIERARSEYVREAGVDQSALLRDFGIAFAVVRIEADYLAAARFNDDLVVQTELDSMSGARLTMAQRVSREEELLFRARVVLACRKDSGKPSRLPGSVRQLLESHLPQSH